jgi:fructose-1,6-bisphosphatase/inositol monophosphatase family enzyme
VADPALDDPRVPDLLRYAADRAILPRWRSLSAADVRSKATADDPADVVTVADVEAELIIAAGLREIRPDAVVIGEEAVAADPSLLDDLGALLAYWLVDPVDGTANFVDGSPDFGVMVALVEGGRVSGGWIWLPVRGLLAVAVRGAGATLDGRRVDVRQDPVVASEDLRAWITVKTVPPEVRAAMRPGAPEVLSLPPPRSAAVGYVRLLEGGADGALFWRSHPWDHAPGSLLLEESGGLAARLDGSAYLPGVPGRGLLAARDARSWPGLREAVFGDAVIAP